MKRAKKCTRPRLVWVGVILLSLSATARSTMAESNQAAITQIVNDVKVRSAQTAARPVWINDKVGDGSSVQTGMDSRAELTFADNALARLSANTIFSFNHGTRNLDLATGAVLLRVPKGAGRAEISTASVSAAVGSATVIVEFQPHVYLKFISLEGTARLYLKHRWGESVLVRPGQILITNPDAKGLPDPVDVDLGRLLKTSLLIQEFPTLGSGKLIAKEIEKQQRAKSKKSMIDTNMVIFGKGTLVSLTNPTQMTPASSLAAPARKPALETIPSSTDLGTIETPPSPQPPNGSSAADHAMETAR